MKDSEGGHDSLWKVEANIWEEIFNLAVDIEEVLNFVLFLMNAFPFVR